MRRADVRASRVHLRKSRFEIDRSWLLRGILVVLLIGFVVVLAKVATIAFEGSSRRLERHERMTQPPPTDSPPADAGKAR